MKTFVTQYSCLATESTHLLEDIVYPQRVHMFTEIYDKVQSGLVYVPHELANRILTKRVIDYVKQNPVDGKTAFLLAAGSQGWAGGKSKNQDKPNAMLDYTYKMGMLTMTNVYAGRIAAMFEAYDYITTDASACASGIKCMADAKHLIDYMGFDRVIILALEDSCSKLTLEFFGQMKANISLADEQKGIVPTAFDSNNGGFYVGQGAGLMVFESERAVSKNKPRIYAELMGTAVSAEQNSNPIGQRPDGQGYQRAIRGAIESAKVTPSAIKLVKTHGTGTATNNAAEKNALNATLDKFIATSYKPTIGHTVAASGVLETGMIFYDISKGVIPAIKNRTEEDKVFLSEPAAVPDGLLLSLAAGMGNIYAAAIFDYEI